MERLASYGHFRLMRCGPSPDRAEHPKCTKATAYARRIDDSVDKISRTNGRKEQR